MASGGSRKSSAGFLKSKLTENEEEDEEYGSNVNVQIIRGLGEKLVYSEGFSIFTIKTM